MNIKMITLAPALFPSLSFGSGTTPAVLGAKPTTVALLPALLSETAAVAAAGEKRGKLQIVVAVAVVLKAVQFLFVIETADGSKSAAMQEKCQLYNGASLRLRYESEN
uniref:Uncharacterized protein n=1 Tax=Glossina austeni TaxID=7395 RepID=A0A1A9UWP1_GLOAU